jgi:uncharacterized membrane protein YfcA
LFLPLGLASIPAAFIGGTLSIPSHFYKPVMGEVLLLAAWHVFSHGKRLDNEKLSKVSSLILLSVGAGLGFLSGLTGIGGGVKKSNFWGSCSIYFSEFHFWFDRSIVKSPVLSGLLRYWVFAVVLGGLIGAEYGSRSLENLSIRMFLVGSKMIFSV